MTSSGVFADHARTLEPLGPLELLDTLIEYSIRLNSMKCQCSGKEETARLDFKDFVGSSDRYLTIIQGDMEAFPQEELERSSTEIGRGTEVQQVAVGPTSASGKIAAEHGVTYFNVDRPVGCDGSHGDGRSLLNLEGNILEQMQNSTYLSICG